MTPTHETYQDIEISSRVLSATPVQLIQLLFDKVLQQTAALKYAVETHNLQQKHRAVNQIAKILQYLRDCLNIDNPETSAVAASFDKFYAQLETQLFFINLKNEISLVDDFYGTFNNVASAWSSLQDGKPK